MILENPVSQSTLLCNFKQQHFKTKLLHYVNIATTAWLRLVKVLFTIHNDWGYYPEQ